ncbi:GPI-anchored surface protein, putative, partial [Bodo saltans]
MGVKYLSTFLRCHADKIGQLTELPPLSDAESEATQRRNIIVDSHGFLMAFASEVISRCESELGEESFRYAALAGGDLQYIRSAMTFMITRLRHVYGVELVFAVDAPSGIVQNDATNRGAVVAKRGVERETLLAKQLEVCATTNMSLAADKLLKQNNRPQMLVEQLYETLFQLNVIVKHLDDEVDRYIGALVHDFNPICVFTGDSDFVVTPGIPVVMDFDYPWDVMLHGWDASVRYSTMANDALRSFIVDVSRSSPGISVVNDEPLCLLIVESAGLASFLDLDDENVLLLAMSLCGNDITEVVVKEIGPPQIADRDFQTAAVLAKEIANYPTRIDKTKGLFSQIRRGNSRKEILRVLGLVKNLLERVRVEGPEELRAWFYSSPYEWGQVQKIFEPKWFVNWIFSVPVNDSVCVAVVHALDALASMSTDFIAILNYMECDDDTLSNATGHNSSGTKSSNSSSGTEHNSNRSSDSTDSFVDEDPFLKSLEPFVPFEILLSIQQYKLSSQRVAYEPIQFKERPEERVLYDNFTSQRLPLSLLLIARSGQCHDHPIPVISGRFGFSLDLFTFYRLRQVIARHLGRVTIRVRNHSGDVVKPCEPKLSDDWPTAATAPVVPTDDDGSEQQQQQADIRTHREVPVSLPENVMDAAKTGDAAIYEIFDANKDVLQSTLSNNEGVNGDGPPSAALLVMWVVHAGCTSFDEVRRLAEMMVLLHYSERGDEEMASAARSAVKGVARFNHERSLERGSCARGRRLRGSPTHRTIELSRLFAAAFAEVLHLVKLLGTDNVWHLPEPADVFSGTLLHDLMTLESPLCLETLVRSA